MSILLSVIIKMQKVASVVSLTVCTKYFLYFHIIKYSAYTVYIIINRVVCMCMSAYAVVAVWVAVGGRGRP